MALANRLAGKTPAECDTVLHELWVLLVGTEQWEALQLALREIEAQARVALLSPRADPYERAHAAGQVVACQRLLATAHAAATFDPQTADYSSGAEDDESLPDDEHLI